MTPKANRIIVVLIYELPDRLVSHGGFILQRRVILKRFILFGLFFLLCPHIVMAADTIRRCGMPRPFRPDANSDLIWALLHYNDDGLTDGIYIYTQNLEKLFETIGTTMTLIYLCIDYVLPGTWSTSTNLITYSSGTPDFDSIQCPYASAYNASIRACTYCNTGYIAKIPTDGTRGIFDSFHTNTTCAYCDRGYYKSGSSCLKCPDDGSTADYDSAITDCYIWSGTQTDSTGTYASQKCYYQP